MVVKTGTVVRTPHGGQGTVVLLTTTTLGIPEINLPMPTTAVPASWTFAVKETVMGRPSVVKLAHLCVDKTPLLSTMSTRGATTGRMDSACGDEAKMLVCGAVMFSVGQAEPAPPPVPGPVLVQRVTVTVMGGGSWLLEMSTTEKLPFCTGTPAAAPRRMGAASLP